MNRPIPRDAPEVDRRLRNALHELRLAERNALLWFAEVMKRRLFRDLGYSSIYHYAGDALAFSRSRTAQFIRLADCLDELPVLKESVASGDVSWTKAREIVKVATPESEAKWVDLARRESRRKLERRVRLAQCNGRSRRRGGPRQLGMPCTADDSDSGPARASNPSSGCQPTPPSDHADSLVQLHGRPIGVPVTLSLRLSPEQYARYEAILETLRKCGERASREDLFLAGLEALLDPKGGRRRSEDDHPTPVGASRAEPRPVYPRNLKPVYQIVVQQCEVCGRAHVQTNRGAKAIDPAVAEAMRCDARVLRPGERNRSAIPPAVRRKVLARDGHRCTTPGCGSARFLEVHHLIPRIEGGANRPDNLITLCSACRRLTHVSTHAGTNLQAAVPTAGEADHRNGRSSRPGSTIRAPAMQHRRKEPKPPPG